MRRPRRMGQLVALGITLGIIFLWAGGASAIPIITFTETGETTAVAVTVENFTGVGQSFSTVQSVETVAGSSALLTNFFATNTAFLKFVGIFEGTTLSDFLRVRSPSDGRNLELAFWSDPFTGLAQSVIDAHDYAHRAANAINVDEIAGPMIVCNNDATNCPGFELIVQSEPAGSTELPEPGTLFLLGLGLVGVGGVWRRRRHN